MVSGGPSLGRVPSPAPVRRGLRWLAVIVCLLSLTACSSATFFYNRLNFFVPWYLSDYVDLDKAQDQYLDDLLVPFLSWHRKQELPRYGELLDRALAILERDISAEDLSGLFAEVEAAGERLQSQALTWMIPLGERLSDKQMRKFIEELREEQAEHEEELLERDDDEYQDDVYDRLRENLSDYLGRLNTAQRERLHLASTQTMRLDAIWLSERALWLDKLEQILKREPGWQQRLLQALKERGASASPTYNAMYDHNLAVSYAVIVDVVNMKTPRQHKHLFKKLRKLRADVADLVGRDD